MTRARERLLLSGAAKFERWPRRDRAPRRSPGSARRVARSCPSSLRGQGRCTGSAARRHGVGVLCRLNPADRPVSRRRRRVARRSPRATTRTWTEPRSPHRATHGSWDGAARAPRRTASDRRPPARPIDAAARAQLHLAQPARALRLPLLPRTGALRCPRNARGARRAGRWPGSTPRPRHARAPR